MSMLLLCKRLCFLRGIDRFPKDPPALVDNRCYVPLSPWLLVCVNLCGCCVLCMRLRVRCFCCVLVCIAVLLFAFAPACTPIGAIVVLCGSAHRPGTSCANKSFAESASWTTFRSSTASACTQFLGLLHCHARVQLLSELQEACTRWGR